MAAADVADPMQPTNNGESFADVPRTPVLTFLLIVVVMLLLCLFCKYKMQQSNDTVVLVNQVWNHRFQVRATNWYCRLLSSVSTQINELASSESFKKRGGKIKLLGIEGDVKHGIATREEWTALLEDVDRSVRLGIIMHRPQNQRLPLDDLDEALAWCQEPDILRHIIIVSCPRHLGNARAMRDAARHDHVHISFVVDHQKEMFDGTSCAQVNDFVQRYIV